MSTIQLIDPLKDPRWDRFVQAHPFGWVCHLSGWKKVIEESFRHMTGYYFVLLDPSGKNIQAGLPIYHVRSWILGDRLVSIPFATLCDPLISSRSEFTMLLEAVNTLKRQLHCSLIEIKTCCNSNLLNNLDTESNFINHYIDLNLPLNEIFKSFHRKTVRQSINRSMKFDLELCKCAKNEINRFYPLYAATRKKIGLPPMPFKFFNNLWIYLQEKGLLDLYFVKKKSIIIAALICLKFKKRVSAEVMGWDKEYSKICPNHFLYWNVIKKYKENGYEIFDFGRTHISDARLMEFKKRWGTAAVEMPQFNYPPSMSDKALNGKRSVKYQLLKTICAKSPNCTQKLIGNFCYRHLG